MGQKTTAPAVCETTGAALQPYENAPHGLIMRKDNHAPRNTQQRRIYSLLSDGRARSTVEISIALHLCDPRAVIRDLRRKGVGISDEWRRTADGKRYKVYFMRKEVGL